MSFLNRSINIKNGFPFFIKSDYNVNKNLCKYTKISGITNFNKKYVSTIACLSGFDFYFGNDEVSILKNSILKEDIELFIKNDYSKSYLTEIVKDISNYFSYFGIDKNLIKIL